MSASSPDNRAVSPVRPRRERVLVTGIAVLAVAASAVAANAGPGRPALGAHYRTIILSQAQAIAQAKSLPQANAVNAVTRNYSPLPQATIERLTQRIPDNVQTLSLRTVVPLGTKLYVADWLSSTGSEVTRTWSVDVKSGAPTLLFTGRATENAGRYVVHVAGVALSGHTSAGGPAAAPSSCDQCLLADAEGHAIVELACGIAGAEGDLSLICFGLGMVIGTGAEAICNEQHCSAGAKGVGGYLGANCTFGECDVAAAIRNPTGKSLSSLKSDILWIYAPGTSATLPGGGYASEIDDTASASLAPTERTPDGDVYLWKHYASKLPWADCSAYVQVSVTAQWSDASYWNSGFSKPQAKPAMTTCPGFHAG